MDPLSAHPNATALEQRQGRLGSTSLPITISLAIVVVLATRYLVKVSPRNWFWTQ